MHLYSSLSVSVIVMTPSIFPLEDNGSINSWSSVAIKIGIMKKVALDCHPICTQLVGFHQGVIHGFTHPDRFFED